LLIEKSTERRKVVSNRTGLVRRTAEMQVRGLSTILVGNLFDVDFSLGYLDFFNPEKSKAFFSENETFRALFSSVRFINFNTRTVLKLRYMHISEIIQGKNMILCSLFRKTSKNRFLLMILILNSLMPSRSSL